MEIEYFCSYFCLVAQNEAPGDVLLLKMKIRPYFLLKIFLQTLLSIYFRKNKTNIPKKSTLLGATSAETSPSVSHGFGLQHWKSHEKSKIFRKLIFKLLFQECPKVFRNGLENYFSIQAYSVQNTFLLNTIQLFDKNKVRVW